MRIPTELHYTDEHLWTQPAEDGTWLAGITDYAQDLLGDIVFVETPPVGSRLEAGKPCGLVESVKTGSDLHAPMDGEVVAINEVLQGNPEHINDKPYASWIFKYRPSDAADAAKLLDAKGYETLLGQQ
jgi:glycine cleavage system H protein